MTYPGAIFGERLFAPASVFAQGFMVGLTVSRPYATHAVNLWLAEVMLKIVAAHLLPAMPPLAE